MELYDLLHLVNEYTRLGWAVQEQLQAVADDWEAMPDQNANALRMIAEFLDECVKLGVEDAAELHEAITDYLREEA